MRSNLSLVDLLLAEIADRQKRVVIIGDVMVDRWVQGYIDACQDGCPKFVQEAVLSVPGGAANAERSISRWPANTSLYGWSLNECPVKTRYVEDDRIVFRADDDSRPSKAYPWAHVLALEMAEQAGAVLLSDYDKGFLTQEFIIKVVALCRARGIPCVADCKREPEVYEGCIIKANGKWGVRYIDWDKKGYTYVETHGANYPGVWQDNRWIPTQLPKYPIVKCLNHVGAGDCFAAHLALALAYGFAIKDAASLAHSAGRVYVQKPHNEPPDPADISADLLSAT